MPTLLTAGVGPDPLGVALPVTVPMGRRCLFERGHVDAADALRWNAVQLTQKAEVHCQLRRVAAPSRVAQSLHDRDHGRCIEMMLRQSSQLSNGIRKHRYPLRDCHAGAGTEALCATGRASFQLRKGAEVPQIVVLLGQRQQGIAVFRVLVECLRRPHRAQPRGEHCHVFVFLRKLWSQWQDSVFQPC